MRVAFVHPDLGLGGAERLMVDAAVQLQRAGHAVTIFTAHHDPRRSFEAARDGTLDVRVISPRVPFSILGHLCAPCVLARMMTVARNLRRHRGEFDVVFCDLVAHVVPHLAAALAVPVVFYCHFPDLLLMPVRGRLMSLYRIPINRMEGSGIARAAQVLVNSRFTQGETARAFPKVRTEILYPGIEWRDYQSVPPAADADPIVIACVNRFERQKNARLAIGMLARLRRLAPADLFARLHLVMAGGFDGTGEAMATRREMQTLAREHGVADRVEFLTNPSDAQRINLLERCRVLVHTNPCEHFGLVPVEAMAAGRAVIAAKRGGPLETIVDGRTGFLSEPEPDAFAQACLEPLRDLESARRLGAGARRHVRENFSLERFGGELEAALRRAAQANR